MLKSLSLVLGLVAVAPLAASQVGCAKKNKTEEPAAAEPITLDIGKLEVIRRPGADGQEKNQLRATLRVTNGQPKAITIDKVEYSYGIGSKELGTDTDEFGESVAPGEMGKVTLVGDWNWREDSNLPGDTGYVKGTIHWTGGSGNARTTPFDFSKAFVLGE